MIQTFKTQIIKYGIVGIISTSIHIGAETCVTNSCYLTQVQLEYGGRIVDHLKHGLEDPKNDLFFVGFQAKGNPGQAMVEGRTPAKATIHCLSGYSTHADQRILCDWVKSMPEPPGEIRLVHGEPEAQKTLKSKLEDLF